MDELDEICQENQLARYPVSRGRNSEEALLERYPELVTSLEIDRQRRVDSMRLSSRRDQDELFDGKIRASVFDRGTPSPSVRKMKVAQSGELKQSVGSPTLKARQSMNDLMFQMDDESAMSPTPVRKGKAPMTDSLAEDLDDLSQPPALSLSFGQGDSIGDINYLEAGMGSLGNSAADNLITSTTPTIHPTVSKGGPWVSPDISGDKRNLKDIMAETSTSRVSNLTLGMTDRSSAQSAGTFSQKMSQKERKRLQQIQAQEALEAQQKAAVDSRQSPWQTVSKKPIPTPRDDVVEKTGTNQPKTIQKPAMTLRQTVAGSPSIRPVSKPEPSPNGQGRSVSQPLPGPSTNAKPMPANTNPAALKAKPSPSLSPISTPQPIIQSIRHTPRPERSLPGPAGQASLALILLQQQAEKDEIREAASAKHKLQDIQAEQEFQEWWDKESKRVMEAEAAAAAAASQSSKGRNARRKNRGQQQSQQQPQQPQQQQGGNKPQQQRQNADKASETPRSHGKRPNHRRPPKNSPQPSTGPSNSRPESITNQS
jgi:hypothetical protein